MSRRTQKNVGVIGLGIIGSRVREVLRRKGFHVFVWNRTPRPVPNFVGAPVELAEMCDYIQIFVSDDEALLHVAKQLSPGLAPRHIVMAHSTVAPQSMRSEEHTSELQSRFDLVCRLLLEKKKQSHRLIAGERPACHREVRERRPGGFSARTALACAAHDVLYHFIRRYQSVPYVHDRRPRL